MLRQSFHTVQFVQAHSRRALIVVGMPVFSAAWWTGRDFTARGRRSMRRSFQDLTQWKTYRAGPFIIEYSARSAYWARNCAVQSRAEQLRSASAFEYIAIGMSPSKRSRPVRLIITRLIHVALWIDGLRIRFPRRQPTGGEEDKFCHDCAPSQTPVLYPHASRSFQGPGVRGTSGCFFRLQQLNWTNRNHVFPPES